MHVDHTTVQWPLNLFGLSVMHIAEAHKDKCKSYIKVHHEMLGFCPIFTNLRSDSCVQLKIFLTLIKG